MKKLLIFASFGVFLAAAPALAQDDHHHDGGQGGGGGHPQGQHGGGQHAGGQQTGGQHAGGQHAGPAHMAAPTGPMSGAISPHHDHHGAASGNNAAVHQNAVNNNAMRANNFHGQASHGNFAALHRNFTAPRRFHAGSYHRPRGYYSHRWSFGERLPSIFFVRDYWINDFDDYGLMDPPPGTVWVRYGDDALLIDEYTGEVIQVEYGIFY